jgi:hypothetical protein
VELGLFDDVADALHGLVPPALGQMRCRAQRYGIKVWFDTEKAPREHYEAQVVGARHVDGASVLALEIGFHAEHRQVADNDAALARLTTASARRKWRGPLGDEPVAGGFLGRSDDWRRFSETWLDPDLGEPGLAFEIAARLTDYVTALEPLRHGGRAKIVPSE